MSGSDFAAAVAFGLIALLLLSIGWRRGFFHFPQREWEVPVRLIHVVGAFAIYFLVTWIASSIAIHYLKSHLMGNYLTLSSWLNFGISFSIFVCLGIYLLFMPERVRKGLLRRPNDHHPLKEDVKFAFFAWVMAFPLVLSLSQFFEMLVFKIFQVTQVPDQLAVKFLKSTFENPVYFILAVISIVILAPLIEETLFRGFLQSFIRQHLGPKQAILITSACFSLFHYSAGQGLGNISIILSLFILALFLGFVYEKKGCILASMVLHSLFNTVSVINLYLFGGFTTGI